ncbi:MAG: GNAT family N-acetyltransferase [Alphaproteobacteria bacterium]|nr:GNAT family N-acetyltransferase [Alphaproteobacteria bacterium]
MTASDDISIRPIALADRPRWAALLMAHGRTYGLDLGTATIETTWAWIADRRASLKALVAVDSAGEIVGIVHYQLMYRSLAGSMSCYLSDLYVAPSSRGRGIGGRLVAAVLEVAGAHGCRNVRWLGHESNQAARRLYDRFAARTDFVLYEVPVGDASGATYALASAQGRAEP